MGPMVRQSDIHLNSMTSPTLTSLPRCYYFVWSSKTLKKTSFYYSVVDLVSLVVMLCSYQLKYYDVNITGHHDVINSFRSFFGDKPLHYSKLFGHFRCRELFLNMMLPLNSIDVTRLWIVPFNSDVDFVRPRSLVGQQSTHGSVSVGAKALW